MRRARGFRIGRKLVGVFTWVIHRRAKPGGSYRLLEPRSSAADGGALSKLRRSLGGLLKRRRPGPGYVRVGQEAAEEKRGVGVPKGHLAVYVGEKEDGAAAAAAARRVVVPVIYFNHPLFADLLREAETVYGFNHPGGIQIPCRISEFENVQSRIAATGGGDGCNFRRRSWRHRIKW
ncbi:auxin-responsive protein SAUR36-like [Ipomoea triloba]|uniref:auxin-responsive protein SAUR36-like n=1 Tax=Ipomoea triloba TaxID=35885 RepID=UPI00125D7C3F|nr:auxin-responsive protein SAUR36-like [Ipomoea triloba]